MAARAQLALLKASGAASFSGFHQLWATLSPRAKAHLLPLSPSLPRDGKHTAREPTRTSNISAFPLPQDSGVDGFGWPSHTRVHNSVGFSLQPSLGCIQKKKSETWREFLINWFEMLVTCKYLSACLRKNINCDQSIEASQYGLQGKDIHGHGLQWNLYLWEMTAARCILPGTRFWATLSSPGTSLYKTHLSLCAQSGHTRLISQWARELLGDFFLFCLIRLAVFLNFWAVIWSLPNWILKVKEPYDTL